MTGLEKSESVSDWLKSLDYPLPVSATVDLDKILLFVLRSTTNTGGHGFFLQPLSELIEFKKELMHPEQGRNKRSTIKTQCMNTVNTKTTQMVPLLVQ